MQCAMCRGVFAFKSHFRLQLRRKLKGFGILFLFFLSSFHTENCHLKHTDALAFVACHQPTNQLSMKIHCAAHIHTPKYQHPDVCAECICASMKTAHCTKHTEIISHNHFAYKLHVIRNVSPFVIWICNGKKRVRDWTNFVSVCVCVLDTRTGNLISNSKVLNLWMHSFVENDLSSHWFWALDAKCSKLTFWIFRKITVLCLFLYLLLLNYYSHHHHQIRHNEANFELFMRLMKICQICIYTFYIFIFTSVSFSIRM